MKKIYYVTHNIRGTVLNRVLAKSKKEAKGMVDNLDPRVEPINSEITWRSKAKDAWEER